MHRPSEPLARGQLACVQARREEAKRDDVGWRWRPVSKCSVRSSSIRMEMRERRLGCGAIGWSRMTGAVLPRNTSLVISRFCATTDALRDWVCRGRFGVYAFTITLRSEGFDPHTATRHSRYLPAHYCVLQSGRSQLVTCSMHVCMNVFGV
jgi:hypothetical protein